MTEWGQDPLIGTFRLGSSIPYAPYLLPRLVPSMHQLAPLMPLYLQENFTHNLAEQLHRGELDVVVVAHPFIESGIVTLAVYDEPFCLALSAGHPLAEQESVKPAQVASENLLL